MVVLASLALPRFFLSTVCTCLPCMPCRHRKRAEREKDKGLRDSARVALEELKESLSQGLALVSSQREHPGIKPQADTGTVHTAVL